MSRLTFDRALIDVLLAHAMAATEHRPTLSEELDKTTPVAALHLVGDDGIYLLSNDLPGLRDGEKHLVAYARECDPTTMDSDTWYDAKARIWGGDDGVDALPAAVIAKALKTYPPGKPLVLYVDANSISIASLRKRKVANDTSKI